MFDDETLGSDGRDAVRCKAAGGAAVGAAVNIGCCGTCLGGAAAAGAEGSVDDAGACVEHNDFIVTGPSAPTLSATNLQSVQLL